MTDGRPTWCRRSRVYHRTVADEPTTTPRNGVFARWWRALTSARGFRWLAGVTVGMLWIIFPSGGFVRLSGSGLGCSDWPMCNAGGIVPANNYYAWIEFSNRLLSLIVVLVVLIAGVAAFKAVGSTRAMRIGALVAVIASIGQIPLGGLTVLFHLHPLLVGSHFALSLVALAGGVVAFLEAADVVHGATRTVSRGTAWLAVLWSAALSTVVVTGVLVTSSGPHSGDALVIKRFWVLDTAMYVHLRAVIALLIVGVIVAWIIRGRRADRGLMVPALLFIPVFIAQVIIGEAQWRNHLPWDLVLAHVTVAAAVWGLGVAIAWRLMHPLASGTPD